MFFGLLPMVLTGYHHYLVFHKLTTNEQCKRKKLWKSSQYGMRFKRTSYCDNLRLIFKRRNPQWIPYQEYAKEQTEIELADLSDSSKDEQEEQESKVPGSQTGQSIGEDFEIRKLRQELNIDSFDLVEERSLAAKNFN